MFFPEPDLYKREKESDFVYGDNRVDEDYEQLALRRAYPFTEVGYTLGIGEWMKQEKDPNGLDLKTAGAKADDGKAPILRGALQYFPRALRVVSQISAIGAKKYSWKGWASVDDGVNRYGDALVRHLIEEELSGPFDKDTGCLHAGQVAWNALARLELILRQIEPNKVVSPKPGEWVDITPETDVRKTRINCGSIPSKCEVNEFGFPE